MAEIRVWVVRRGGRSHLVLRWRDPRTGRLKEESAGTIDRDKAQQRAGVKQHALSTLHSREEIPWGTFRKRYEREVLALQRPKSLRSFRTAAKRFEDLCAPQAVQAVNASLISQFTSKLHDAELSLTTIGSYLRELRRGLRWAAEVWEDYTPPRFRFPRVPKRDAMKGRPITGEEFDRMLAAIPAALTTGNENGKPAKPKDGRPRRTVKVRPPTPEMIASWKFLLRGLWHSGLRLDESLDLWWDRPDKMHVWEIDHRRPMLRILAESEKGNRDRLLPIIPDFAALLRSVPPARRHGQVFRPLSRRGQVRSMEAVSTIISAIGKKANVVVAQGKDGTVKYASAQDLRRGFGARLAPKLHPMQLRELMRHESLETTMRYYVGLNAVRTANDVWAALEPPAACDQDGDNQHSPSAGCQRKSELSKNIEAGE